jgi:hypothetical protein
MWVSVLEMKWLSSLVRLLQLVSWRMPMKVTVCFDRVRVIVPCGDGEIPVYSLIEKITKSSTLQCLGICKYTQYSSDENKIPVLWMVWTKYLINYKNFMTRGTGDIPAKYFVTTWKFHLLKVFIMWLHCNRNPWRKMSSLPSETPNGNEASK